MWTADSADMFRQVCRGGGSAARVGRVVYLATELSRMRSLGSDRPGCKPRTLANCKSACTFQDIRAPDLMGVPFPEEEAGHG